MRTSLKILLPVLALCLTASVAFAQDPPPAPGAPDGPDTMQQGPLGPRGGFGPGEGGWGPGHPMGMRGFGMGMHRGGHPGFMLARLIENPALREKLGITDDQVAKIRQQSTDFRKAQIRSRADLQVKRIELHDLLSADKPDRAAIDKKLQEISAAQLARERAMVDFHFAMRDVFTPEQRAKLKQLREEFRMQGPGRMGPRGPRSPRWQKPQETPPPANPGPNGEN